MSTLIPTIPLSGQEAKVINHAASGLIDKQIALEMEISLGTVRVYWKRIRNKFSGATRSEVLVAYGRLCESKASLDLHTKMIEDIQERILVLSIGVDADRSAATVLQDVIQPYVA